MLALLLKDFPQKGLSVMFDSLYSTTAPPLLQSAILTRTHTFFLH